MTTVIIKIEGFIQKSPYGDGFEFTRTDMSKFGYVMVGPYSQEIAYEIPADWSPVAEEINALERELVEASDEFMRKSSAIKSRIADLKCITNESEQLK